MPILMLLGIYTEHCYQLNSKFHQILQRHTMFGIHSLPLFIASCIMLNPKVSQFFHSFLPQFVDPVNQLVFFPFFLLGMIFFTTGSIWCLMLVHGATRITGRLLCRASLGGILKKATGALFADLGIKLAISGVQ